MKNKPVPVKTFDQPELERIYLCDGSGLPIHEARVTPPLPLLVAFDGNQYKRHADTAMYFPVDVLFLGFADRADPQSTGVVPVTAPEPLTSDSFFAPEPELELEPEAANVPSSGARGKLLIDDFVDHDQIYNNEVKGFFERYNRLQEDLLEHFGEGYLFQDRYGTVYKTVVPEGTFVSFKRAGIVRTKREGETRGSLSVKEAEAAGFTVKDFKKATE